MAGVARAPGCGGHRQPESLSVDPRTLLVLIGDTTFQIGLLAGAAAVLVAIVASNRLKLDWGLLWAVATGAAWLLLGAPGEAMLNRSLDLHPWALPSAVVAASLSGWALWRVRDRPLAPIAVVLSLGGVWATVPDTELIAVQLGVSAGLLWAWWPRRFVAIGRVGVVLVPAVAMLAVLIGGSGRRTGLIGGLGAMAILAGYALLDDRRPWLTLGVHLGWVLGWARLAGLRRTATAALIVGAAVTVGGFLVARLAGRAADQIATSDASNSPGGGSAGAEP